MSGREISPDIRHILSIEAEVLRRSIGDGVPDPIAEARKAIDAFERGDAVAFVTHLNVVDTVSLVLRNARRLLRDRVTGLEVLGFRPTEEEIAAGRKEMALRCGQVMIAGLSTDQARDLLEAHNRKCSDPHCSTNENVLAAIRAREDAEARR